MVEGEEGGPRREGDPPRVLGGAGAGGFKRQESGSGYKADDHKKTGMPWSCDDNCVHFREDHDPTGRPPILYS